MFLPGSAPIRDGALLIGEDGRITDAGADHRVGRPEGVSEERFPAGLVLPGLINTHTHLELTGFDAALPEADFTGWIRHLMALKAARTPGQMLAAARQGIRDCWAAGVTTVADTGDSGAALHAMLELGASGVAYQEVFGPHPEQAALRFAEFRGRFDRLRALATGRVVIGVSPHAPYSVSGPLYALVAEWARQERLPLAVHIAESLERLTYDSDALIRAVQTRYVDSPQISRILDRIDHTTEVVARDAEPLLRDAREALKGAYALTEFVAGSMRVTTPFGSLGSHAEPAPNAIPPSLLAGATGIFATT